jgi:hypothetical protein
LNTKNSGLCIPLIKSPVHLSPSSLSFSSIIRLKKIKRLELRFKREIEMKKRDVEESEGDSISKIVMLLSVCE